MAAVGELVNPDHHPLLILLVEAWQVLEGQEASIEGRLGGNPDGNRGREVCGSAGTERAIGTYEVRQCNSEFGRVAERSKALVSGTTLRSAET
jgi:hypothetical protein